MLWLSSIIPCGSSCAWCASHSAASAQESSPWRNRLLCSWSRLVSAAAAELWSNKPEPHCPHGYAWPGGRRRREVEGLTRLVWWTGMKSKLLNLCSGFVLPNTEWVCPESLCCTSRPCHWGFQCTCWAAVHRLRLRTHRRGSLQMYARGPQVHEPLFPPKP